jgi:DNA-binding NarL/FixJ family response regulator
MPSFEPTLTPRRREIAVLLTEGRTLTQIARILTITPEAVANDVEAILWRLDSVSRAEVMSWAVERRMATATRVDAARGCVV